LPAVLHHLFAKKLRIFLKILTISGLSYYRKEIHFCYLISLDNWLAYTMIFPCWCQIQISITWFKETCKSVCAFRRIILATVF